MSTAGRKILKIVAGIAVGAGLVAAGFALGRSSLNITGFIPDGRFRFGMLGFGFGLGSVFAIIVNILFWVLIIGAVAWLIGSLVSGRTASNLPSNMATPAESALDILKKRYARGEITKTEYEDLRRDLGT